MKSTTPVYLRADLMMEPLVDQWYAWPHLLSPGTLSMNIVGRHLKIMQSYLDAPAFHAAAVKDPRFLGGPFIDYATDRSDEIQDLIAETRTFRRRHIEFHDSAVELDSFLLSRAKGFSLESVYQQVPASLQGFVELVYDLNDQPSFRLVEPLLYRSELNDRRGQSIVLSRISGDDRPFVLSTPRLTTAGEVRLALPFAHPGLDVLFSGLRSPRPIGEFLDAVEMPLSPETESLFIEQAPPPYQPYTGGGIRWRYFGHACILVEFAGTTILVDPCLSYTYDTKISRYTYLDLPDRIDYALITHNHPDHLLLETVLQLRHRIGTMVVPRSGGGALQDPSLKFILAEAGFRNILELDEMDEVQMPGGTLTGLPFFGEHGDLNIRTKLSYLIRANGHSILFAADSCNIAPELYVHLRRIYGPVEVLFLGMECDGAPLSWLYGPLRTSPLAREKDATRRFAGCNYERARDMVDALGCREVYVYAMGQEPWLNYIMSLKYNDQSNPIIASNRLIDDCRSRNIVAERLFAEKEILID
jgi:L-ascorbate metabolism protein UlaG (beta-lactamase superfamily)